MDGRGGASRSGTRGNVRSLARASARPCARPGCPAPAQATLSFRYGSREAEIGTLLDERDPNTYDLCLAHADRTRPPHGWDLVDARPTEPIPGPPAAMGDDRTVALLAEALGRARAAEAAEDAAAPPSSPSIAEPAALAVNTPAAPPVALQSASGPVDVADGRAAEIDRETLPRAARAPLALRDDAPSYPVAAVVDDDAPAVRLVEPQGDGSTWDQAPALPSEAPFDDDLPTGPRSVPDAEAGEDIAVLTQALGDLESAPAPTAPPVADGTAGSW